MATSYLSGAHDLQIQNLTINHHVAVPSSAFDHLHNKIVADALHNSGERCDAPKCHPETRTAVQKEILSWIDHGDEDAEPKNILWLTGPAGAGKTAIAGSIAEVCDDESLLAGSFFFSSFSGSETRRTKCCLIATLAYCLLQHDAFQPLRGPMLSAIERDPSIFRKSLSGQCKALILKPFQAAGHQLDLTSVPRVVIIDGLDEVEAPGYQPLQRHEARLANEAEQREILAVLLQIARDPHFPFRILIASRPEPVIRDFFSSIAGKITREVFLDNKYDPDSDIALFLNAKFGDIQRRYRLSSSWPGAEVLKTLVHDASGQFIYAATIVRFLETSKEHPEARLEHLLPPQKGYPSASEKVLSPLDTLYTLILKSSPDPLASARWIGVIVLLGRTPAYVLRQFVQDYPGELDYLLDSLASLVSVPPLEDLSSPFTLYHMSLVEFLVDPERCGQELNEACWHGRANALAKCSVRVLSAKSPSIPLENSERQTFTPTLLNAPRAAAACIGGLFARMHRNCPVSKDLANCKPSCQHWRRNLLAGCKSLGWRVPNAIALLREKMGKTWAVDSIVKGNFLSIYFVPPSAASRHPTSDLNLCPLRVEADYDSTCALADLMYSRLPEDWAERYGEQLDSGRNPSDILRHEIDRVISELGVDIEDRVILSAGAQRYELL